MEKKSRTGTVIIVAVFVVLPVLSTACQRSATPTPIQFPSPAPAPQSALGWNLYTNANDVRDIAFASNGDVWTVSDGWAVRWNPVDGTYTKYTTAESLADNDAHAVAVAADGAIWVGTDAGVSRFDGETWFIYTTENGLLNDLVTAITVAPDGTLWFLTGGGVSRFDGEAWTNYKMPFGRAIAVTPDGVVWVGTFDGLLRFDGQTWTTYSEEDGLPDSHVEDITIAADGTVWAVTWGGVSRFDGEVWATPRQMAVALRHTTPRSIAVASDGAVWVATDTGAFRFDGETWSTYTEEDGLMDRRVNTIAIASDDTVWVGTVNGMGRFDGQTWRTYLTDDGLPANRVYAVAVTSDRAAWFATEEGVTRCDSLTWTTYTDQDGLATDVRDLAVAPDGSLWAAAGHGVSHFDGESWTTYTAADGLPDNDARHISVDAQGIVWVSTRTRQLVRFDGHTWTIVPGVWLSRRTGTFASVPDGSSIWFDAGDGVGYFDGVSLTVYTAVGDNTGPVPTEAPPSMAIIEGGKPEIKPEDIHIGEETFTVRSKKEGYLLWINNASLVELARLAGAPKDKGAGVRLHKKIGDVVKENDPLFTIHAERDIKLQRAIDRLEESYVLGIGERMEMLIHEVKELPVPKKMFMLER